MDWDFDLKGGCRALAEAHTVLSAILVCAVNSAQSSIMGTMNVNKFILICVNGTFSELL